MKRFLKNQHGQTAIEYLLLLVVSISIGVAFYNKLKEFMLENPNSGIAKQLKTIENTLNQSPGYKRYTLPR